jgi:hypothetical protein
MLLSDLSIAWRFSMYFGGTLYSLAIFSFTPLIEACNPLIFVDASHPSLL